MAPLLLFSVFIIATCGLVYELIAGTLASYLLGDSITQFSTIIGVYLFSMGIGSWLSKYMNRHLLASFARIEIAIGVIGGSAAAILFLAFAHITAFRAPLYTLVFLIGMLVGAEIPLLMRILKNKFEFKDLVSKVMTFDYIGALFASLLFPLILVPHLGLIRSGFMFGAMNVLVALWLLFRFPRDIPAARWHRVAGIAALVYLMLGFAFGQKIMQVAETNLFPDPVIYSASTHYQRIVITKSQHDLRLFLNNNLQFSTRDEYRYHEALVHPGMAAIPAPKRVLVLGGGDGLAVREILKYPTVESITMVELDPAMTKLFSKNEMLSDLSGHALSSPKLNIVNSDAFPWLREHAEELKRKPYDFVVVDFPDPSNFSIGKLYTQTFYRLLNDVVSENGYIVVQSTSPYVAPKAYSCVIHTLESVGFQTVPYHVYVPSFGEWGFILAGKKSFSVAAQYPAGLKFIDMPTVNAMLQFPDDMKPRPTDINRLDNQSLVHYFDEEWSEYGIN